MRITVDGITNDRIAGFTTLSTFMRNTVPARRDMNFPNRPVPNPEACQDLKGCPRTAFRGLGHSEILVKTAFVLRY